MPVYQIEQYELHTQTYRVEATTEAEAIVKLLDGEADPVDNTLEYVEIAEDFGMPVDEHKALAAELSKLGVPVGECVIPSIRHIEISEEED